MTTMILIPFGIYSNGKFSFRNWRENYWKKALLVRVDTEVDGVDLEEMLQELMAGDDDIDDDVDEQINDDIAILKSMGWFSCSNSNCNSIQKNNYNGFYSHFRIVL